MQASITNIFLLCSSIWAMVYGQEVLQALQDDVELVGGKTLPDQPFRPFPVVFQPAPIAPSWRVSAIIVSGGGAIGEVVFRQYAPGDVVFVTMNITGLPPGKHSVHIHEFGDLKEGCLSTGSHVSNIGNVEVKENGLLEIRFNSPFLTLFGTSGIVGRAIVMHEKPIEYGQYPDIQALPLVPTLNAPRHQTEEMRAGAIIGCGIITITSNRMVAANPPPGAGMPMP